MLQAPGCGFGNCICAGTIHIYRLTKMLVLLRLLPDSGLLFCCMLSCLFDLIEDIKIPWIARM